MDGGFWMNKQMNGGWAGAAVLSLMLGLQGCGGGGGEDTSQTTNLLLSTPVSVNTPQDMANEHLAESHDDYNDNLSGLITASTLKRWKDDWVNQRPAHITGKLVILQVTPGGTVAGVPAAYIKPDNTNVFTYLTNSGEWTETRDNGVTVTVTMVASGAKMDESLNKYNIDPTKDMIVLAPGAGTNANPMNTGRIWYAMRYWGIDTRHLAQFNGANYWEETPGVSGNGLLAADFSAAASPAPATPGKFTVKYLRVDNTQMLATMADMKTIAPTTDVNDKTDGIFIWDARNLGQYSAGEKAERGDSTAKTNCGPLRTPTNDVAVLASSAYCDANNVADYKWTFQNNGSRQGHPNGTLQLQYTNMLEPKKGYGFKPKAELQAYLDGGTDIWGYGFVGSSQQNSYGILGPTNAYQSGDVIYAYCETTVRAMVTGFAAAAILGKPVRFYDGAMTEWNSLSYALADNGQYILPSDSPWRSEANSFLRWASDFVGFVAADVKPRTISNAYGTPNKITLDDQAYKGVVSSGNGGGGGGGGSAPTNPCGG
ncbi:MAG: hypothetical protein ABS92_11950 [Thiobacillus sp. SCN 63-374]|nr:MAG: hypothetical protein ABS92_11950 [Thiobacillus sp. SCN 63-374]